MKYDYFKLASILKYGILSANAAKAAEVNIARNYGGHNGGNSISLSKYSELQLNASFNLFSADAISVIVDTTHYYVIEDCGSGLFQIESDDDLFQMDDDYKHGSGIQGEIYINGSICPEDIVGIMLPSEKYAEELMNLPIGLNKMGYNYVGKAALAFAKNIIFEFDYNVDLSFLNEMLAKISSLEIMNSSKKDEIISKIDFYLRKCLSEAVSIKYGVEKPTLSFLVNIYNTHKLPIYLSNGKQVIEEQVHRQF